MQTNVNWKEFGWVGRGAGRILEAGRTPGRSGDRLGVLVVAIWRGRSAARAGPAAA